MTSDDLLSHPIYQLLTPQQQTFLFEYARTRSWASAQAKAYPDSNKAVTQRHLKRNEEVMLLVDLLTGTTIPSKEDVVALVWRTMRGSRRPHEIFRGTEILSDLLELGVTPQPNSTEQRKIEARRLDSLRSGTKSALGQEPRSQAQKTGIQEGE